MDLVATPTRRMASATKGRNGGALLELREAMGYNLTQASVERWKDVLDELLDKREPVRIDTNDPIKLSYKLREAIAAAKAIGYNPYDTIEMTFSTEPGCVVATPREDLVAVVAGTIASSKTPREHAYEHATNEFHVVEATIKAPSTLTRLLFPNFAGELAPVERIAQARGYVVDTEPILILRREEESAS